MSDIFIFFLIAIPTLVVFGDEDWFDEEKEQNMINEELKNKYSIPVEEAANVLGMSPQTLRAGLIQSAFPFGVGFKGSGSSYFYYVHKGLLEEFLKGNFPFGVVGKVIGKGESRWKKL